MAGIKGMKRMTDPKHPLLIHWRGMKARCEKWSLERTLMTPVLGKRG